MADPWYENFSEHSADATRKKVKFTDKNKHKQSTQYVIGLIECKITVIQQKRFKLSNFRRYFKVLRKFLHLNKNPKKKGYDKFLTDEERRWLEDYKAQYPGDAGFLGTSRIMANHC